MIKNTMPILIKKNYNNKLLKPTNDSIIWLMNGGLVYDVYV